MDFTQESKLIQYRSVTAPPSELVVSATMSKEYSRTCMLSALESVGAE